MKKLCNVDIKGTTYRVYKVPENDDFYGQMHPDKKVIHLTNERLKETIMHELMHCYLFECGHDELYNNENLQIVFSRFALALFKNYSIILKAYNKLKNQINCKKEAKSNGRKNKSNNKS